MGGDGGSIPRRVELVRNRKDKERAEKFAVNSARWNHCALSQQPLREPIVACKLGRLYNKEAIIEKLLDKSKYSSSAADHINRLKDVRELKLTPALADALENENSSSEKFRCPIMNIYMNGSYPFVFSWICGCVVSKRAVDAVRDEACLKCGEKFGACDLILLNPETEEDKEIAMTRLNTSKKPKQSGSVDQNKCTGAESVSTVGDRKRSLKTPPSTMPVTDPPKKEKKEEPTTLVSLQDDPSASKVFKSLFNTCEEARNQPKAHWVTFNPLYFR